MVCILLQGWVQVASRKAAMCELLCDARVWLVFVALHLLALMVFPDSNKKFEV